MQKGLNTIMKKWKSIICGIMLACAVLFMPRITCLAATVDIGVTTLADAAYFNQEWAGKRLIITCGNKVWEKPIAELMGENVRLYVEEGVGPGFSFVNTNWANVFLAQVNRDLRLPDFQNPDVPAGSYYQLINGFTPWYLDVVQKKIMTEPAGDISITLNNNTCAVIPAGDAASYVIAGTCTTSFQGSSAERITNILVAAGRMNGYVLASGARASIDVIFGSRTSANGYMMAGVFSNGRIINGIGGGICQVSSTAYNALMNAGITVTMRYPHSSPVAYLPLGTDAAIAAGYKDLRFRNNYAHPVMLETIVAGNTLTVNVYVQQGDMNGLAYQIWAEPTGELLANTYQNVYANGQLAEVRGAGVCRYRPLIEGVEY